MSDDIRIPLNCPHGETPAWCFTCLHAELEQLRFDLRNANATVANLQAERKAVRDALEEHLTHPLFESESLADSVHRVAPQKKFRWETTP